MPVNKKNKKIKKDIQEAAGKIPELIFEEVEFKNTKENKPPQSKHRSDEKNKKIVWIGVITTTLIVLVMWSWNIFVNFDTILKKDESSMFEQFKESLDMSQTIPEMEIDVTTSTPEKEIDENEIQTKIKNSLNILLDELKKVSSTEDIVPSTTNQFPIANDAPTTNQNKI